MLTVQKCPYKWYEMHLCPYTKGRCVQTLAMDQRQQAPSFPPSSFISYLPPPPLLQPITISLSVPVLLFFTFLHLLISPLQSLAPLLVSFLSHHYLFSHFLSDLISCLLYISPPLPCLFFTFLFTAFHLIFRSSPFVFVLLWSLVSLPSLLFSLFLFSFFIPIVALFLFFSCVCSSTYILFSGFQPLSNSTFIFCHYLLPLVFHSTH